MTLNCHNGVCSQAAIVATSTFQRCLLCHSVTRVWGRVLVRNAEDVSLLNFSQAASKGFVLIQTKEVTMRPEDVKRVFQNNAEDLVEWITKGRRKKKTLKTCFISVLMRFFWWIPPSAQILCLHSLSVSSCFLLFFIIRGEKRRWRHTHMTQYDFTADG